MKCFAVSAGVGRETSLVPEASPLKAFQSLGFCTCLYVVNWQMLTLLLGDIDYQRKWPPLIDLKVDYFLFFEQVREGGESKSPRLWAKLS